MTLVMGTPAINTERAINTEKGKLRHFSRCHRRLWAQQAGSQAGEKLRDHVMGAEFLAGGGVVAAYWPVRDEIDTRPLLEGLAKAGIPCALPVMMAPDHALIFRLWRPGMTLVTGRFGIQNPDETSPEVKPHIILVPLLAFDRAGHRLGYGGGYYDRTLATWRPEGGNGIVCGLAFAAQYVPMIPHEPHDQPLDWVGTETGLYPCPITEDMT